MRLAIIVVLAAASGSALAQNQEKGQLCAEDVDCKGEQICVKQVCAAPPEPEKPALATPVAVHAAPTSRVEFSLAPQFGLVSQSSNDRSSTNTYVGATLTNAFTMVPALGVVVVVDLRWSHPNGGELDRYLSITGGLRLQTPSRTFAIDLLVGWTQLYAYQSVGNISANSSADGTALGVLAHYRVWGPVDVQIKATENIFGGFKSAEIGLGFGIRI
jgi:hypothetical protein